MSNILFFYHFIYHLLLSFYLSFIFIISFYYLFLIFLYHYVLFPIEKFMNMFISWFLNVTVEENCLCYSFVISHPLDFILTRAARSKSDLQYSY